MHQEIGIIGLGKMGHSMAMRLQEQGFGVFGFDEHIEPRKRAEESGLTTAASVDVLVQQIVAPRTILLMVPHGTVQAVIDTLAPQLAADDTIIDGGNSYYEDSMRRATELKTRGVHFLDMGVSGGPAGARHGACLMVGGDRTVSAVHEPLFQALATDGGFAHVGPLGAGHFVKMVHNGIEYGMMQALAEGFALMKAAPFDLELQAIAALFSHGSVIESRLVEHLAEGFREFGEDLEPISGTVAMSGEGEWTVMAAKKTAVPVPAIETAVNFRTSSADHPNFTGKILSVMRNRFGGHKVDKN